MGMRLLRPPHRVKGSLKANKYPTLFLHSTHECGSVDVAIRVRNAPTGGTTGRTISFRNIRCQCLTPPVLLQTRLEHGTRTRLESKDQVFNQLVDARMLYSNGRPEYRLDPFLVVIGETEKSELSWRQT